MEKVKSVSTNSPISALWKNTCTVEMKRQILEDLKTYIFSLHDRKSEAVHNSRAGSTFEGCGPVSEEDINVQDEIFRELTFRATDAPRMDTTKFEPTSGLVLEFADAMRFYVTELIIEGISRRLECSMMSEWMIVRQEKLLIDTFYNVNYLLAMSHHNWQNGNVVRSIMHRLRAEFYEWSARMNYATAVADEFKTAFDAIRNY
jgi:hypothetical protein